jgi:hypothetical protein
MKFIHADTVNIPLNINSKKIDDIINTFNLLIANRAISPDGTFKINQQSHNHIQELNKLELECIKDLADQQEWELDSHYNDYPYVGYTLTKKENLKSI